LYVEDDNGNRSPVSADGDEDSELVFTVEPQTVKRVVCNFQVDYPKLRRKIVWLQHGSHRTLISQRLQGRNM
jgi:hypothetical protein